MRKLLIADDEEGIRKLVRMTLQRDSFEIIEATDGEEALELAREHLPELLLLDVAMPGLSGLDVCKALKSDPATAGITIVMLTAQAQQSDVDRGQEAGADDYFTKPFSPVSLLRKVDEVFEAEEPR